jgi:hypothetical protein
MIESKAPASPGARTRLNDRLVRKLTVTAAGAAVGMAGLFSALAALPNPRPAAEAGDGLDPSQQSLASAIEDYEAAVAVAARARAPLAAAKPSPGPARPTPAPPKRPPVAVSGGS